MKTYTQNLIDEQAIEMLVEYEVEPREDEIGYIATDINSCEVVIAGKGIDIKDSLSKKQYQYIIEQFDESGYCDELHEKKQYSYLGIDIFSTLGKAFRPAI